MAVECTDDKKQEIFMREKKGLSILEFNNACMMSVHELSLSPDNKSPAIHFYRFIYKIDSKCSNA